MLYTIGKTFGARSADSVKRVDCYFRSRDRAPSLHRVTHTRELSQQRSGTFLRRIANYARNILSPSESIRAMFGLMHCICYLYGYVSNWAIQSK